jgi:glutaredoxin
MNSMKMIIYSKPDCPWCDKAKAILENLHIQYVEKIFNEDFTKEDLCAILGPDIKPTVPQIFRFDGIRIGGYEDLRVYLEIA